MAYYIQLKLENLSERAGDALGRLESCEICPRCCRVNRLRDERGFCGIGRKAKVSSYSPHFGEEPPLVGRFGSGTIFFSGCNLSCAFCQNYEISQIRSGWEVSPDVLANMMLRLQDLGCHNINFVTPTHVIPQILEALVIARERCLDIPLVYNSSGYDCVEMLKLLDGIFDIYMPDAKYGSDDMAIKYSCAPQYTHFMKAAIYEMYRQVGDLILDEDGIAVRGLLVRHLVLPENAAGTEEVVRFISHDISRNTYLNVMDQYHPDYKICHFPELNRRITSKEYNLAVATAAAAGLTRGLAIL